VWELQDHILHEVEGSSLNLFALEG
jgi:hypothetical protein